MSAAITAAVVGVAGTAYAANKSSKASKATGSSVPKTNIKKDIKKYVSGVSQSLPKVIGEEGKYRPQFQGLNLGDIQSFLGGTSGQTGVIGLGGLYGQQVGQQIAEQRGVEFGQMTGQSGMARILFDQLTPEAADQVRRANEEAQRAYAAARGLTPQETRASDQQTREAFAARGMLNSNSSVAAEAMSRYGFLGEKRQEAAQRGQEAFNYGQQFYTQPGLQALSSVPHGYTAGQNQMQIGLGAIGAGAPQLFDFNAAMGVGATDRQNQFQAAMAANAANQNRYAGYMQAGGQLLSSGLQAYANRPSAQPPRAIPVY